MADYTRKQCKEQVDKWAHELHRWNRKTPGTHTQVVITGRLELARHYHKVWLRRLLAVTRKEGKQS